MSIVFTMRSVCSMCDRSWPATRSCRRRSSHAVRPHSREPGPAPRRTRNVRETAESGRPPRPRRAAGPARSRRGRRSRLRSFTRHRRRIGVGVLSAGALAAAGFAVAMVVVWESCRGFAVASNPKAHPNCLHSAQAVRPEMAVAAATAFLILGALAVYVATNREPDLSGRPR